MPLKEKNLESSTRDPQGSCTPKSLWVSESSCILCSASEEKPWAHIAGLPVEEMWSWCLDWVPSKVLEAQFTWPSAAWSCCQPWVSAAAGCSRHGPRAAGGSARRRGGWGWGESPPAMKVSAVKSADGQAMMVEHLALPLLYLPTTGT